MNANVLAPGTKNSNPQWPFTALLYLLELLIMWHYKKTDSDDPQEW